MEVGNEVEKDIREGRLRLMIVTKEGKMIRIDSGEIRQAGRSTQGVRLVRMKKTTRLRRLV